LRTAIIRLGLICALFLVAFGAGYALSSSLGQGAIRREAQTQLSKLMRGRVTIDRADIRIRRGLWLEGQGVKIYPGQAGPGLSGARVAARIDLIALLTGRFRIRDLVIEGVQMEIERSRADHWSPYPIDAIDRRGPGGDPDDLERKLASLRVIDIITRTLLERPLIAQRIEVKNGSVRITDRFVRETRSAPFQVRIDAINGTLAHDWLAGDAKLEITGTLEDEARHRVPIEVHGAHTSDGEMRLSIAFSKLELEAYRSYFQDQDEAARREREAGKLDPAERPVAGRASGLIRFETPAPEHGVIELDWAVDDLHLGVPRDKDDFEFSSPHLSLRTRVEIHPGRVRISDLDLVGPDLTLEVSGDVERPLRGSSPARFEVFFKDLGLDAIGRFVSAMSKGEREPLRRALARIESGRVVKIGGAGTTRFSVWQAVLRGERLDLPPGLAMQAEVDDVTLRLDTSEHLRNISGALTWTRDQIRIHHDPAARAGESTPRLNLTLEGFPVLFENPVVFDPSRVSNTTLPGIGLLGQLFAANAALRPGRSLPLDSSPVEIQVEVDHLEHHALIWPLRNAKLEAVLLPGGQSLRIEHGQWGNAQVSGDVLLTYDEQPTIDAQLKVWKQTDAAQDKKAAPAEAREVPNPLDANKPQGWAAGRFLVDGLDGKHWPMGPTVSHFTLVGDSLSLGEVHGRLVPRGRLEGRYDLDLSSGDQLFFRTDFSIRDGDAGRLLEAVGFPDDFVTGTLNIDGGLAGPIFPDRDAFSEVEGEVSFHARHGEIRQRIALIAALAHAAEGLSPTRASDALLYETLRTDVRFERGTITSDEIKIDGPLRVFLSGRFDFAKPGRAVDAEVGVFLFRQVDRLLGNFPLLGNLIPGGKDRGLFGAFFAVEGTLEEPVFTALPMKSLTDGVPLPDLIKAPFSAIREALAGEPEAPARNPAEEKPRS